MSPNTGNPCAQPKHSRGEKETQAFAVTTAALCRDCGGTPAGSVCPACGSRRVVRHPELFALSVAHVDCDAFFASVEKRDRPDLAGQPVIVGGGVRGVVAASCYVARMHGVRSAMPMWQALKACPDAVVIRPEMAKYAAAARHIRTLMQDLTPLVQPLSIDEAVLDLSGTESLHGAPPAAVLARFALRVEREVGVTVSVGLARNRLLSKLAAGRDKPRGFAVLGSEAAAVLAAEPVRLLPGVGPAQGRKLHALGITHLMHLQALDDRAARVRLGDDGPALARRARGEDARPVNPDRDTKSVSAETTFDADLCDPALLEKHLWRMAEKLARRLREGGFSAGRGAEAEDGPFRQPDAQCPAAGSDDAAGQPVCRGAVAAAAGGGWDGVPPDRPGRQSAAAGRAGRSAGPGGPRRAPAGSGAAGGGCAARAVWRGGHQAGAWAVVIVACGAFPPGQAGDPAGEVLFLVPWVHPGTTCDRRRDAGWIRWFVPIRTLPPAACMDLKTCCAIWMTAALGSPRLTCMLGWPNWNARRVAAAAQPQ